MAKSPLVCRPPSSKSTRRGAPLATIILLAWVILHADVSSSRARQLDRPDPPERVLPLERNEADPAPDPPLPAIPRLVGGNDLDSELDSVAGRSPLVQCRLPGEFERQGALLLACTGLLDTAPELFLAIARETRGRLKLIALVSNVEEYQAARNLLRINHVAAEIQFAEIPHDSMWVRDYGPLVAHAAEGGSLILDPNYDSSRALDDRCPAELAKLLRLPALAVPLRLDGGNFLSNGQGLVIATRKLVKDNGFRADQEQELAAAVHRTCGLRELVLLEALEGEVTGHADMFATFTDAATVVVASIDRRSDPANSALLDRNARRLSQVRTDAGPLRVIRIPMPAHTDKLWRTYTNVVFANGVLLVPFYSDIATDPGLSLAIRTYSSLLPGWRVVGLDARRLIEVAGALHCITMNLGPIGRLPDFPLPRRARVVPTPLQIEARGDVAADETAAEFPAPRPADAIWTTAK